MQMENIKCDKCKKENLFRQCDHCPKCDSPPSDHQVENFDPRFRDGDVVCKKCKTYVRGYDAS